MSVKQLAIYLSQNELYYKKSILLAHFFDHQFISSALAKAVQELEQMDPINRRRLVWHYFSNSTDQQSWGIQAI